MERIKPYLLPVSVIAAVAVYLLASPPDGNSRPAGVVPGHAPPKALASTPSGTDHAQAQAGTGVLVSPFGRAAPPPPKPLSERVRDRRARMRAMGIDTADNYYYMPLAELRQRAAKKDVLAMLQLAVQYGTEHEDLERQADDGPAIDPRTEQKKYLTAAVNAGHIRSAALMANLYWQEGKTADAYAWHLLAAQLGDANAGAWSQNAFAGLPVATRRAAEKKAQALYHAANQRFMRKAEESAG